MHLVYHNQGHRPDESYRFSGGLQQYHFVLCCNFLSLYYLLEIKVRLLVRGPWHEIYFMKHAHNYNYIMHCFVLVLSLLPLFSRVDSLALRQSYYCPSVSEVFMKDRVRNNHNLTTPGGFTTKEGLIMIFNSVVFSFAFHRVIGIRRHELIIQLNSIFITEFGCGLSLSLKMHQYAFYILERMMLQT